MTRRDLVYSMTWGNLYITQRELLVYRMTWGDLVFDMGRPGMTWETWYMTQGNLMKVDYLFRSFYIFKSSNVESES